MKKLFLYSLAVALLSPMFGLAQLRIPKTPFMPFRFSSEQCKGLVYPSGSRIYVPKNAFVLKKDNTPYSGEVVLKYREYRDRWDFVSNELSLNTDDHFLESAGMFEIRAETPGAEPLELRRGKQIQVRFANPAPVEDLKSWFWDEERRVWVEQPFTPIDITNKQEDESDKWGKAPAADIDPEGGLTEEELSLSFGEDEWGGRWGDWSGWGKISEGEKRRSEVFKAMNIDKMGLRNYDALLKDERAVPVLAEFEVTNAPDSTIQKIYVVYEKTNSVVYYHARKNEVVKNFRLLDEEYKIFCIFGDGSVAKLPDTERKNGEALQALADKRHTFRLLHEPRVPETKEQLRQLTR